MTPETEQAIQEIAKQLKTANSIKLLEIQVRIADSQMNSTTQMNLLQLTQKMQTILNQKGGKQ